MPNHVNTANRLFPLITILGAAGLASCGGGGGAAPTELEQAAAVYSIDSTGVGGDSGGDGGAAGAAGDGAPIKRAVITLTDAKGNQVSGLTDNNGRYLLKYQTKNFTPPLVIRVIDAGGNVLSSVTEESAAPGKVVIASVNPLTDKITSDVLSASVSGTDKSFDGSKVDPTKLGSAKTDLVTSVKAALGVAGVADPTKFEPIKSIYSYNGVGADAVIESISHSRSPVTGATQLGAKLASAQYTASGSYIPTLITASTPLATTLVAVSSNSTLTFDKLNNWISEMNRCLALAPNQRNADADCVDADGTRSVSKTYSNSTYDLKSDFSLLFSNADGTAVQGSSIRNPTLLFTSQYVGSTSAFDDLAVVEVTIQQPSSGPLAGNVVTPMEYTRNLIFKRDDSLTKAKAGNWILHGNQAKFNRSVSTRYIKLKQMNPLRAANSSAGNPDRYQSNIQLSFSEFVFDPATRTSVRNNVKAVRVTGPGLPSIGVVLVPSSAIGANNFAIFNKTGVIPSATPTTIATANSFALSAVTADGSPIYSGFFNTASSGVADVAVTDFSPFGAYARYKFEVFLNTNTGTTPDVIEYSSNTAPVYNPTSLLNLPYNDLSPSIALATAPAPAASTVNVQWVNNLNAGPVYQAQIVAQERNPKGSTTTFTVTAYDEVIGVNGAYSLNVRPTSQAINAITGTFPSLNANTPGDFRMIAAWAKQGRASIQNLLRWDN